jgi:hypothetical protein
LPIGVGLRPTFVPGVSVFVEPPAPLVDPALLAAALFVAGCTAPVLVTGPPLPELGNAGTVSASSSEPGGALHASASNSGATSAREWAVQATAERVSEATMMFRA